MQFSKDLIGEDLQLVENDRVVIRRDKHTSKFNSSTIVFYPWIICNFKPIVFNLRMNWSAMGFGKLGLSSRDPKDLSINRINGLELYSQIIDDDNEPAVIEIPQIDLDAGKISREWSQYVDKYVQLMLVRYNDNQVCCFLNFHVVAILPCHRVSCWIYFDLAGPLHQLELVEYVGIPDLDILPQESDRRVFFRDLLKYGGSLDFRGSLNFILEAKDSELNPLLEMLQMGASGQEEVPSRCMQIRARLELQSNQLIGEQWMPAVVTSSALSLHASDTETTTANPCSSSPEALTSNNLLADDTSSINTLDICSLIRSLEFFESEWHAAHVVQSIQSKKLPSNAHGSAVKPPTTSTTTPPATNQPSSAPFSNISIDLSQNCRKPLEEISNSVSEHTLPIIEKLIDYFLRQSCLTLPANQNPSSRILLAEHLTSAANQINANYCLTESNHNASDDSSDKQEPVVKVTINYFRSILQYQIQMMFNLIDAGSFMVLLSIDSAVDKPTSQNLEKLEEQLIEWCWLMYQGSSMLRADTSKSILLVLLLRGDEHAKTLTSNVDLVTKHCMCCVDKHPCKPMVVEDPVVINLSAHDLSAKVTALQSRLAQMVCRRPRAHQLLPSKWRLLADHLTSHLPLVTQTKMLSFSQLCQVVTSTLSLTDIDQLSAILQHLSRLQHIIWTPPRPSPTTITTTPTDPHNSLIIIDKACLTKLLLQLHRDIAALRTHTQPFDAILSNVLKSFSYHKLLFISLLKHHHCIISEPNTEHSCLLEYISPVYYHPITKLDLYTTNDKRLHILWNFSMPLPWILYCQFLARMIHITANDSHQCYYEWDHALQTLLITLDESFWMPGRSSVNPVSINLHISALSPQYIALELSSIDDDYTSSPSSTRLQPIAVAKVRQYIEQQLLEILQIYLYKMQVSAQVVCTCNSACTLHNKKRCRLSLECMHFLRLDQVLCTAYIHCSKQRRVSTEFWRRKLPSCCINSYSNTKLVNHQNSNYYARNTKVIAVDLHSNCTRAALSAQQIPTWMHALAKSLSANTEQSPSNGFNWTDLATRLGYKESSIRQFKDNKHNSCSLNLLVDWIVTSGNNYLSIEFLKLILQEAGQFYLSDLVELAEQDKEHSPQVFISYQWHNQTEARSISEYLESRGLSVWMDVGQMGGGELLLHRIESAVRQCAVVVACISPHYVLSSICHRELVLADLLRKPLVPVLLSRTMPWPAPGGSGLLLAPYVYIDLYGAGGHGGSGLTGDICARYNEIYAQINKYCPVNTLSPAPPGNYLDRSPAKSQLKSPGNEALLAPRSTINAESRVSPVNSTFHINDSYSGGTMPQVNTTSQTSVRECSSICTLI